MRHSEQREEAISSISIFSNPIKLIAILIPYLLSFAVGAPLMGMGDTIYVVTWFTYLMLIGLATLPLSAYLYKNDTSAGFFFSQPLGLIISSLVIWTLAYLGPDIFNNVVIIVVIFIMAISFYMIKPLRNNLIRKLEKPHVFTNMIVEESVFVVALTLLCYFKGFSPDINGQEKFMDYGFIMSMLRSDSLPAADIWLSGHSINYYYYGQYIYAFLIKLAQIPSGVGYNLAMCSAIAIPFAMCYSLGTMFIDASKEFGLKCNRAMKYVTGAITAFAVMVFGNSHSFFYDPNSAGINIVKLYEKFGVNVGSYERFFYPDSTRYIGHNPKLEIIDELGNVIDPGDYTIEEFPFYSFLVGDLHAHVVSTMVVLLIMGLCLSLISRSFSEDFYTSGKGHITRVNLYNTYKFLMSPELVACGILLGVAQMTNYWDFLIYFIFCSMTLFVLNTRRSYSFCTVPGAIIFASSLAAILGTYLAVGDIPLLHLILQLVITCLLFFGSTIIPCALTRTTAGMSFLFTMAHFIALPFNWNFDMISNSLGAVTHRSSLYQLSILWGTHILIGVIFVASVILTKNYRLIDRRARKRKANVSQVIDGYAKYSNPVAKFFCERNTIDVFVCGMFVVGLLLLIAPEIFYVRDIYVGGYLRANTMFKFTYAAFIILSVTMSYAVIRLFWMVNKSGYYSGPTYAFAVLSCLLLLIPAHYSVLALTQRSGTLTRSNYKTLDGTAYIHNYSSPYMLINESGNLEDYLSVINWFNENVEGEAVLMEAYGSSYTDNNIVSAYTGTSAVCGWETHEWLWRYHGIVDKETDLLVSDPERDVWQMYLTPRHNDIMNFYTCGNPDILQEIINKYGVDYIVLGDLERAKFGYDNTFAISQVGDLVYTSGTVSVYKAAHN